MLKSVVETLRNHAGKTGVVAGAGAVALALSGCTTSDMVLDRFEEVGPEFVANVQRKNDLKLSASTAAVCANSIGALQRLDDPAQQLELILICPGGEEMLRSILALLEEDRGFASGARLDRLRGIPDRGD